MAIRNIRTKGDEILSKKAKRIEIIDEKIKEFATDMIDTLYANDGIGLAACQVGMLKAMIVYDVDYIQEDKCRNVHVCINPKIISRSKALISVEEGCLSFPEVFKTIKRHEKVTLEYTDLDGKKKTVHAKDMEAIVIQHETDHLEGVTFIDRLNENI
ncbi:MAG: peptide deformylase [Clostridia bacterium]